MNEPIRLDDADSAEIPQNLDAAQALQLILRKINQTTTELTTRMDRLELRLAALSLGAMDLDLDDSDDDDMIGPNGESVEEQLKVLDKIYTGLDVLARMDPVDIDAVLSAMAQKFDANRHAIEDEISILQNGRNLAERIRMIVFEKEHEEQKQKPN